jgi:hypothetical protein
MATDKRQFTLRLQDDNFEKIRFLADLDKRSIAMEIEYIIERYIGDYEKEHGHIKIIQETD